MTERQLERIELDYHACQCRLLAQNEIPQSLTGQQGSHGGHCRAQNLPAGMGRRLQNIVEPFAGHDFVVIFRRGYRPHFRAHETRRHAGNDERPDKALHAPIFGKQGRHS